MIFRKCYSSESKIVVAVEANTADEADKIIETNLLQTQNNDIDKKLAENTIRDSYWVQSFNDFTEYQNSELYKYDEFKLMGKLEKKSVYHIQFQDREETLLLYKRCSSLTDVHHQLDIIMRMFDNSKAVVKKVTKKNIRGTDFWTIAVVVCPNDNATDHDDKKGTK